MLSGRRYIACCKPLQSCMLSLHMFQSIASHPLPLPHSAQYFLNTYFQIQTNAPLFSQATKVKRPLLSLQVMSLWIWLSQRFGPDAFPGLEAVAAKSEAVIDLMNKGLQQMCELNKRRGRSSYTPAARVTASKNVALLLRHEPLAAAYLADARDHKFINNYEWSDPNESKLNAIPNWSQHPTKRTLAAA